MTSGRSPLLVLGLDGGTFDVLMPLAERGVLPHLRELMDRGSWGELASTIPPFTAAAWSTFITGQNPGRHGVLSFRTFDRHNYDTEGSGFVDARQHGQTLWEILSAAGRRVCVLNVPLTYPPRPANGLMVTGMLTPPGARRFTHPPDLAAELGNDYIIDVDFIAGEEGFRTSGFPPKSVMLPQIHQMLTRRAEASLRLLAREAWDFFMVVFTSTDRIFHFFWDDLEALLAGEQVTGEALARRKALLEFFAELDVHIGSLVAAAGPDAQVMVLSDHGFGPSPRRRFFPNLWLEELGLLRRRGLRSPLDLEYWRVVVGRNRRLKSLLRRLIPAPAQAKASQATAAVSGEIIEWEQSQAHWVPIYFHVCGIVVNVAGRQRQGVVAPGAAYEAVRDRVLEQAPRLRDPDTDRPIIRQAWRREELFTGPYVDQFPDVILELDPDYIGLRSLAGSQFVEPHRAPRPGEHRHNGIFIAAGNAIQVAAAVPNLRLIDAPATLLHLAGLAVPTSFDGRVLTEVLDPALLAARPVRREEVEAPTAVETEGATYSDQDEARLEERLRGLGYLE